MNDRMTNEQLRQAIRETWTDTQRCVGADRDAAVLHLNALRVVERNRAWSLIAAAGEQDGGADPGHWHKVAMRQVDEIDALTARAEAAEREAADLRTKICATISRAIDAEASAADWRRISDLRERDIADLRIKFSAAARLERETAGEAMEVVHGDGTVPRLTKEQAVIVSAYTGYLACDLADMHEAIERKIGRSMWTHEMADKETWSEIRDAFKSDFLALVPVKGGE